MVDVRCEPVVTLDPGRLPSVVGCRIKITWAYGSANYKMKCPLTGERLKFQMLPYRDMRGILRLLATESRRMEAASE